LKLRAQHEKALTDSLGGIIAEACDLLLKMLDDAALTRLTEPLVGRIRKYLAKRGTVSEDPHWTIKMRSVVAKDDERKEKLRRAADPWTV
jgi:hypothetical protein